MIKNKNRSKKKEAGTDSGQEQNLPEVNDAACSLKAEDAESTSSPNCPGWPPAEPPEHGWPSFGIGTSLEVSHCSEDQKGVSVK